MSIGFRENNPQHPSTFTVAQLLTKLRCNEARLNSAPFFYLTNEGIHLLSQNRRLRERIAAAQSSTEGQ